MGFFDAIKESILFGIRDLIGSLEKEITESFIKKLYHIKRQIMRELIAIFIIILSIGLLSVSAVYFFTEYLHLTKTVSFLIIGIILLIIGILIKFSSK